jgi:hypothetical protein
MVRSGRSRFRKRAGNLLGQGRILMRDENGLELPTEMSELQLQSWWTHWHSVFYSSFNHRINVRYRQSFKYRCNFYDLITQELESDFKNLETEFMWMNPPYPLGYEIKSTFTVKHSSENSGHLHGSVQLVRSSDQHIVSKMVVLDRRIIDGVPEPLRADWAKEGF